MVTAEKRNGPLVLFCLSDFSTFNDGVLGSGADRAKLALEQLMIHVLRTNRRAASFLDFSREDSGTMLTVVREFANHKEADRCVAYLVWALDEDDLPGLSRQLKCYEDAIAPLRDAVRILLVSEESWQDALKRHNQSKQAKSFFIEGENGDSKRSYVMPLKAEYNRTDTAFLKAFLSDHGSQPRSRDDEQTVPVRIHDPDETLPG